MTRAHRNKYEHRLIIEQMLASPLCAPYVFPQLGTIPSHMTVHHQDHNRTHNCPPNLMLMDKVIHSAISGSYQAYLLAHYDEYLQKLAQQADEVPF